MDDENSPLLVTITESVRPKIQGLSVFFAIICVVDVFGVFPIVALPRAIIQCGALGIFLVLFIFSIQIYTAILLGKCWIIAEFLDKTIISKNRYPYVALAELTFGKHTSRLLTILLDVTVFGAGIPNLLVAAQNLQLFGQKMNFEPFNFSFCYWMIILGLFLCPFLWLGSPKDMKILCSISVVIVFSVSVLIWNCIIEDHSPQIEIPVKEADSTLWENIIMAYGIIAFQFDIHPMLLTIQVDMKDKTKITRTVLGGFLVTTTLFVVTTVLASFKYGLNTYPNILQGLPPTTILYISVLLVTVQLCLTSAVSNSALYQHIEDHLNIPRDFNYKRCILRSSLTILAVLLAESVPKFDLVMSLIGGTLTGPLVLIFPPLFYMKILSLKRKYMRDLSLQMANHIMYHCNTNYLSFTRCGENCFHKGQSIVDIQFNYEKNECFLIKYLFNSTVIIFGVVATCTTSYINILDAIKNADFAPPCLYNITAATIGNNM